MIVLREAADGENERDIRQPRHQRVVPQRGAFAPRRQVGAAVVLAGKAKAHRHDRDPCRVVKLLVGHAEPAAEPHAGLIGVGHAGGMHARARRLAGDQDARRYARAKDRAGLVGKLWRKARRVAADAARADVACEAIEGRGPAGCSRAQ